MSATCVACDKREHDRCTGTVRIVEMDGTQSYFCECYCRSEATRKRRQKEAIHDVQRVMRRKGLDLTHELVPKDRSDG